MFELDTTMNADIQQKMALLIDSYSNLDEFSVDSQVDFDYAGEQLVSLKGQVKLVTAAKEEITKPLNAEKTRVIAEYKPFLEECTKIESQLKNLMGIYQQEQHRIIREKEAIEAEKARKKQAKLMERAQKAADKGHDEKAEELESQALSTQAAHIPDAPKTEGVSGREVWTAEVTNKKDFVIAAATNPALLQCLDINQSNLNRLAVMMKEEFDFPGAKAESKTSFSVRS